MSDAPASDAAALVCSRCDGPVQQEDLVEGLAVRVDGNPVCALCIESLPPAVRVQINRVRALKGLAVTTYRMAWAAHPGANRYTFTSAGLLLLHRRALVHGTEFTTPDLPSGGRPPAPAAPPAAPAVRRKLPLLLVGAAAVAVFAGVGAVLAFGGGKPPAVEVRAPAVPTPSSTARLDPPPATTVPAASQARTANDYLTGDTSALQAFLAAEADGATVEIRERLADLVRADRDTQLKRAKQFLDRDQLDQTAKQLDLMRLPAGREEFRDQEDAELALRTQLERRRKAVAAAVPASPAMPDPVVPTPTAVQPPPVAAPAAPAAPVANTPPAAVMPSPEVPTAPAAVARRPRLEAWTGPLGPSGASLIDADGRGKIPSPWPFSPGVSPPRFAPALEVRGADRKDRFTLQLSFRPELMQNGGVCLALHPFSPKRKELLITRLDMPEAPEVRVAFGDAAWMPVGLPIANPTQGVVQLQITDTTYSGSDPFWLGPVVQVADASPDPASIGMLPSGLLVSDPIFDPATPLRLLKLAAKERGEERKWSDPKYMPIDDGIKVLIPASGRKAFDDKQKDQVYDSLRFRAAVAKVDYMLLREDVTDPEAIAALMARTVTPRLDLARPLVVLIPDGAEAALDPDEWSKRVVRISSMLLEGPVNAKVRGGWIPVWVIGRLDGEPVNPASWSKVRALQRPPPMIDLTVGGAGTPQQALAQLTESLRALSHQLRWVQATHVGK